MARESQWHPVRTHACLHRDLGRRLQILLEIMFERGLKTATPILQELEAAYHHRISFRGPSEILLD